MAHVSDMQSGSSAGAFLRAENGESPTVLFREAGLGPELIGEKRIERCMHRWRKAIRIEDQGTVDRADIPNSSIGSNLANGDNRRDDENDMRDLIIHRQALYIRRLELKADDLQMQLSQQSLSNHV